MTSIRGIFGLAIALVATSAAADFVAAQDKTTPEQFLAKAMDFNVCELDLSRKAATHATSPDVQKFAQHMADSHTRMNKELIALASDSKIAVVTGTTREHKEAMVKLFVNKGPEFDKAFLNYVTRHHEEAVKCFETDGLKQQSQPVRAYVERTLPELRKHLEQAKALGGSSSSKE